MWRLFAPYLGSPVFLAIMAVFLISCGVGSLLLNHLVNYATDIGMTALTAAGLMSALGAGSTLGRLGIGAISDRIGTKADAACCFVLLAVALAMLVSKVPLLMWAAAVLAGVGYAGTVPLIPAIMGERVEADHLGTATGIGTMGAFIGTAVGPLLGGFAFDVFGNYFWALVSSAVISVAGLAIVLRLPQATKESSRGQDLSRSVKTPRRGT